MWWLWAQSERHKRGLVHLSRNAFLEFLLLVLLGLLALPALPAPLALLALLALLYVPRPVVVIQGRRR